MMIELWFFCFACMFSGLLVFVGAGILWAGWAKDGFLQEGSPGGPVVGKIVSTWLAILFFMLSVGMVLAALKQVRP